MDNQRFYIELGKLLYAVAEADHHISEKEKQKLLDIVKDELVPVESSTDDYGTDNAYYAEFEFELAEEQDLNPDEALDSFLGFARANPKGFTQKHRELSIRVMDELAEVYYGINKNESRVIERVRKAFKNL